MDVKMLAPLDRPREKLHYLGAGTVSDAELLAILIGSGTRDTPVLALCEQLLEALDQELDLLAEMTVEELCRFRGIGEAKAITLMAAIELADRINRSAKGKTRLKDEVTIADFFRPGYTGFTELQYLLVLMNPRRNLVKVGTFPDKPGTLPKVPAVIQMASEAGAARIAIVRNQVPEQPEEFTAEERKFYKALTATASVLSIMVDSMLIVTDKEYIAMDEVPR